jgi:DNA-binding beta-propeller fold protein YncE
MSKRAVLALLCLSLAACSGAGLNVSPEQQAGRTASSRTPSALYVAYGGVITSSGIVPPSIVAYPFGARPPAETITDGVHAVSALAFNAAGLLYVSSSNAQRKGSVSIYAPGSTSPRQTISKGAAEPTAMVFDPSGNLYVANSSSRSSFISVYDPNGLKPTRTITSGIGGPTALVSDADGHLFVANYGSRKTASSVTIFAPGQSTPAHTITKGVRYPDALALDSAGNLYVANPGYRLGPPTTVTIYAKKRGWALRRTIDVGFVSMPTGTIALALDSSENLYVLLPYLHAVFVYAPGAKKPTREIRVGLLNPTAFALDPSGNLYVSDADFVVVYGSGESRPTRRIGRGFTPPGPLAFGPY